MNDLEGKQWWIRANQRNGQGRKPVTLPPLSPSEAVAEREEIIQQVKAAINQCINTLTLSVQMLIDIPGEHSIFESSVILEIKRLCDLIREPAPTFSFAPKLAAKAKKKHKGLCINCGEKLFNASSEYCLECESQQEKQERLGQFRKQREAKDQHIRHLHSTIKNLNRDIRELERKARTTWKQPQT